MRAAVTRNPDHGTAATARNPALRTATAARNPALGAGVNHSRGAHS